MRRYYRAFAEEHKHIPHYGTFIHESRLKALQAVGDQSCEDTQYWHKLNYRTRAKLTHSRPPSALPRFTTHLLLVSISFENFLSCGQCIPRSQRLAAFPEAYRREHSDAVLSVFASASAPASSQLAWQEFLDEAKAIFPNGKHKTR